MGAGNDIRPVATDDAVLFDDLTVCRARQPVLRSPGAVAGRGHTPPADRVAGERHATTSGFVPGCTTLGASVTRGMPADRLLSVDGLLPAVHAPSMPAETGRSHVADTFGANASTFVGRPAEFPAEGSPIFVRGICRCGTTGRGGGASVRIGRGEKNDRFSFGPRDVPAEARRRPFRSEKGQGTDLSGRFLTDPVSEVSVNSIGNDPAPSDGCPPLERSTRFVGHGESPDRFLAVRRTEERRRRPGIVRLSSGIDGFFARSEVLRSLAHARWVTGRPGEQRWNSHASGAPWARRPIWGPQVAVRSGRSSSVSFGGPWRLPRCLSWSGSSCVTSQGARPGPGIFRDPLPARVALPM